MRFSSRRFFRSCWVGLLLLPAVAFAANAASVEVTCLKADGSPLRGVEVTLQTLPSGLTEVKKSGRDGKAEFKLEGAGVYRVWGRAEGYGPEFFEFIDLAADGAAEVTLTFEAGDPAAQLPFEDATLAQRSNDLLIAGIQAAQSGDFETALEKVKESIEVNPSNVDAPYNLAVLYLQSGLLDEAEAALKDAEKLLKVFIKIYAGNPAAEELQKRLASVEELIRSMPVQRIGNEADAALKAKDYPTAIAKYRQMTELEPNNAVIFYNLALAQTHANQLEDAKKSIARALELKPDDLGFERLQEQIQQIEKQGISLRASEAINEAQDLIGKKEYQAALDKLMEILSDVPEELQSGSYLLMARAHAGLGHVDEAVSDYRKASELDAARKQAQAEAGEADAGAEEGAEESDDASKQASIDRELASYQFENGRIAAGIETYVQALQKEEAAIPFQLKQLGQTFSRQGKNDAAAAVYEKVTELYPEDSESYYHLGMYHFYDTEQRDKAKQLLQKFVSMGGDKGQIDNAKAVLAVMAKRP